MANIKSAKKRIRVIAKKTELNRARKSQVKTAIRRFEEALIAGNIEEAKEKFRFAEKKISQVAAKGTLHKNAAARKVSKLAKKLNAAIAQA
ncbi:small subunit ribosomal protein S20 [Alkalithermobacter thermoalcaliphilus JW-YL-7 = DSM 7308]|uniref:Small ribosomal subunit protein bS20 n=1 Tax=Alkalithermobacter thermoalcaliphilus JW-YL-7 = DSM 7308 TaxID=1121328 RepID=A0A150FR47_CLOPD|nr:30S ribosomal protein S20 [[Clostridium] paradoxum JW-YL-7 = DSM 7308]SHL01525.1 small subunit ribosomal protein S20 [[Clostridium] paradoxum JW-YL-7 = DSM 7308]